MSIVGEHMSADLLLETLELAKNDADWRQEFYNILANADIIVPQYIPFSGAKEPQFVHVLMAPIGKANRTGGVTYFSQARVLRCNVFYSHLDILDEHLPRLSAIYSDKGKLTNSAIMRGLDFFNILAYNGECAVLNLHSTGDFQLCVDKKISYLFSFEEVCQIRKCALRIVANTKKTKLDNQNQMLPALMPYRHDSSESSRPPRPQTAQEAAEFLGITVETFTKHIMNAEKSGEDASHLYIEKSVIDENGKMKQTRFYNEWAISLVGMELRGKLGETIRRTMRRRYMEALHAKSYEPIVTDYSSERLMISDESESGILKLQSRIKEAHTEIAKLKSKIYNLNSLIDERDEQIKLLDANLAAAWNYNNPKTMWEACEDAARLYGSRILIHPRVKQIVEAWPHNRNSKCVDLTMDMLKALALVLYEMKFKTPDGYINPKTFRDRTGISLAITEGSETKRNKIFDGLRTCEYQGDKLSFYPHLKGAVQKIMMRLHFDFWRDKIVICHLGGHLPNSQTKDL